MLRTLFIILTIVLLASSACIAQPTQIQPTSAPTKIIKPLFTPTAGNIPESEAAVPRVTIEEARTALESGAAIMVDVRSPSAYQVSHVVGSLSIPLGEIEANPTGLDLDKDQWIITYCT